MIKINGTLIICASRQYRIGTLDTSYLKWLQKSCALKSIKYKAPPRDNS